MNLNIHGHHLEVTPALHSYVVDKLARIRRHFDHVIDVDVVLSVDKLCQKAEITLRVRGSALHAASVEPDLYASIDVMMDRLDRQILRYKDRVKNHARTPLKHQSEAGPQ